MLDYKMKEEDLVQLYKDYWYAYKTLKNCEKRIQLEACKNLIRNFSHKWFYFIGKYGMGFHLENSHRIVIMECELNKMLSKKNKELKKKCKGISQQENSQKD